MQLSLNLCLELRDKCMNGIRSLLAGLRDAIAYSFSWLVICVIAMQLISGKETITVDFLIKLFLLCFWGALCFTICFRNKGIEKRGFMFSLSCFYIMFIPVEILLFYMMGIFQKAGNIWIWIAFAGIIAGMYIISLLIDRMIMQKKAAVYTKKLAEYNNRE